VALEIKNLRNVYRQPGGQFEWEHKYDLIFGQWFLENLTDLEILKFLINARNHLRPNGKILFKESIPVGRDYIQITEPSKQKIRPLKVYYLLFHLVGLRVVYLKMTDNFYPIEYIPLYEILLEKDS